MPRATQRSSTMDLITNSYVIELALTVGKIMLVVSLSLIHI